MCITKFTILGITEGGNAACVQNNATSFRRPVLPILFDVQSHSRQKPTERRAGQLEVKLLILDSFTWSADAGTKVAAGDETNAGPHCRSTGPMEGPVRQPTPFTWPVSADGPAIHDLILSSGDTCIGLINSLDYAIAHRYLDDAASTDSACSSLYRNEDALCGRTGSGSSQLTTPRLPAAGRLPIMRRRRGAGQPPPSRAILQWSAGRSGEAGGFAPVSLVAISLYIAATLHGGRLPPTFAQRPQIALPDGPDALRRLCWKPCNWRTDLCRSFIFFSTFCTKYFQFGSGVNRLYRYQTAQYGDLVLPLLVPSNTAALKQRPGSSRPVTGWSVPVRRFPFAGSHDRLPAVAR